MGALTGSPIKAFGDDKPVNIKLSTISQNFLGLPDEFSSYDNARVAVLPVPYEATVSYGKGTSHGPDAIITASTQVELYDDELGAEQYKVGVATLKPLRVTNLKPKEMSNEVEKAVLQILCDKKLPIVLGGEHSITPGIVRAMHAVYKNITVVQFDAHADLRQEYEAEPMSHACAMARVRDICPAVQIGIRNLSKEEAAWANNEKFPIFYADKLRKLDNWINDAIDAIKTECVYVTIDVDAFDSSVMPATGTPEPGGMNWYQVTDFLRTLTRQRKVVGFDLVELSPIKGFHACDFLVAKLAYKCIGYWSA